jgi:hypothetical protein
MTGVYYNELDPYAAQWLRNLIAAGHIAPGDVDERSIEDVRPDDLVGYGQCHFFAGIGGWSRALRLAGIPDDYPVWTGSPHASPIPSLQSLMVERKAKAIGAILRQFSYPSSASENLSRSLESRLRTRFLGGGGTNSPWRLSEKATPARRRFCELTPSVRTTRGNDSSGWPTPAARDGKDISRSNSFLSQRLRHSPSMATNLLTLGAPWQVITAVYCLAMGYPLLWNACAPKATATQSSRKSPRPSSNA